MKRMLAIIFFSLVYVISPITTFADTETVSQDQILVIEEVDEAVVEEGEQTDEVSVEEAESSDEQEIEEDVSTSAEEIIVDESSNSEISSLVLEEAIDVVASSSLETLTNEDPMCNINGLYGSYYNLPKNHSNIETEITGVVTGTTPFQFDWFSEQYFAFKRNDAISTFNVSHDYFPVNTGLEGDPFYFAVHWQGSVVTTQAGAYEVHFASDDDGWLYINGEQKIDLGGIHPIVGDSTTLDLPVGTSTIDIYFAERHVVQSALQFAIDGDVSFSPCVPEAPAQNLPPEFVNFSPPLVATSTEAYSYDFEATDPENDTLEFALTEKPEGMIIATSTGIVSWIPTREQATSSPYGVTVQVSDPTHAVTRSFEILVSLPLNRLPIITAPATVAGTTGNQISFEVSVADPDGDVVTQRQDLPSGATFATTTFSWVPESAGTFNANFFASDGTGTSTHQVIITVTTPTSTGGGGGGGISPASQTVTGGGGGGANGPIVPLLPPQHTSTTPTTNTPIVINVPLKPTPNLPSASPAVSPQVKTPGPAKSISTTPTSTLATTSTPAGGRSFADLLFAGLFNVVDWLRANWCILGWILFIITLITFILYVIFSREDDEDGRGLAQTIKEPQTLPDGMIFKNQPPDSAVTEYWETYPQEKE